MPHAKGAPLPGPAELHTDVCSACHPFYTGTQKLIDAAGRVDRFRKRYDKKVAANAPKGEAAKAEAAPAPAAEEPKPE